MANPEPVKLNAGKPRWLQITLGIMWVFFLFSASVLCMAKAMEADAAAGTMTDGSNLMTLLFGASTISLGVFALLAGGFALFGWGSLKENVKKEVEESLRERIHVIEKELRGRSSNIVGYVIGENSVTPDGLSPSNQERVREAIQNCQEAYTLLKDTGLPIEFAALNNYLYYSCILGDTSRRGYLLTSAERLREAAEERNSYNLLLTYARTVLTFSLDQKQRDEACRLVADITKSAKLNEKQNREAMYLASLCQKTKT